MCKCWKKCIINRFRSQLMVWFYFLSQYLLTKKCACCGIWGSHSGVADDSSLLGYDTVSLGKCFHVMYSSSGSKSTVPVPEHLNLQTSLPVHLPCTSYLTVLVSTICVRTQPADTLSYVTHWNIIALYHIFQQPPKLQWSIWKAADRWHLYTTSCARAL